MNPSPPKGAPIFVPLASEPFWRFAVGTKSVEIRNRDSPVARQVLKALRGTPVTLSRGYGKNQRLTGYLGIVFESGQGLAYLPKTVKDRADLDPKKNVDYFDSEAPIVAFEVLEVRPLD